MKRLRLFALVIILPVIFLVAPVFAIEAPTSVDIDNVKVYRNLSEAGDRLVVFEYSMPYASDNYPTTIAPEAIVFRLNDTDNTTILKSGKPYICPYFENNGWGEGVGSFYLSSADNVTWESALVINILGYSTYFSENVTQSYTITAGDYATETTQADNRELLYTYVMEQCDRLTAEYEDVVLKATTDTDVGLVLSRFGEIYFRGAILGLQNLCPDLFVVQTLVPEQMDVVSYNMTMADTYKTRFDTGEMGEGMENLGGLIGVGGSSMAALITFAGCIGLCIWTSRKGWGTEIGMLGSALVAVGMAILVGDTVFTIMMIASLLAAMGLVYIFILKRAG